MRRRPPALSDYQFNVLQRELGLSSHGQAITLAKDVNGDVVGSTGEGAVFRLSVDADGNVTLTQFAQIDHLPESLDASNDNASVSLASGVITLSATATATDFDHDQATQTVTADLGGIISFDDDVPSVNVAVVVDGGITLTTQDAQTIGVAQDTASASFAGAFPGSRGWRAPMRQPPATRATTSSMCSA